MWRVGGVSGGGGGGGGIGSVERRGWGGGVKVGGGKGGRGWGGGWGRLVEVPQFLRFILVLLYIVFKRENICIHELNNIPPPFTNLSMPLWVCT